MMKRLMLICSAMALCLPLSGCMVAGYSSRSGGFIFPGGLGLLVILVIAFLLFRRR